MKPRRGLAYLAVSLIIVAPVSRANDRIVDLGHLHREMRSFLERHPTSSFCESASSSLSGNIAFKVSIPYIDDYDGGSLTFR
jgi:hypothetical protein